MSLKKIAVKAGGALLVASGAFHGVGVFALRQEDVDPIFIPEKGFVGLVPGWGFLSLMLLASLLTIAGGVAYVVSRRWAGLASVVGSGLLWLAPALFALERLGWSHTDLVHHAGKLVVFVALVALPMIGSVRKVGHVAEQE